MIRFFCPVDTTLRGQRALAYADAFVGLGLPLRIIATRTADLAVLLHARSPNGNASGWYRHRGNFLTPIQTPFINVVCGVPDDWKRLYTVGVRNILIADEPPGELDTAPGLEVSIPDAKGKITEVAKLEEDEFARGVALKYDCILVPTEEISFQWIALGGHPVVVPMELGRHIFELRSALFPPPSP